MGWEIKPTRRLQIKNRSAQITLMKYLSSLTGEISILMAHHAQLSQIMKIHLKCQSTVVLHGWVGAGSEQTGQDKNTRKH